MLVHCLDTERTMGRQIAAYDRLEGYAIVVERSRVTLEADVQVVWVKAIGAAEQYRRDGQILRTWQGDRMRVMRQSARR